MFDGGEQIDDRYCACSSTTTKILAFFLFSTSFITMTLLIKFYFSIWTVLLYSVFLISTFLVCCVCGNWISKLGSGPESQVEVRKGMSVVISTSLPIAHSNIVNRIYSELNLPTHIVTPSGDATGTSTGGFSQHSLESGMAMRVETLATDSSHASFDSCHRLLISRCSSASSLNSCSSHPNLHEYVSSHHCADPGLTFRTHRLMSITEAETEDGDVLFEVPQQPRIDVAQRRPRTRPVSECDPSTTCSTPVVEPRRLATSASATQLSSTCSSHVLAEPIRRLPSYEEALHMSRTPTLPSFPNDLF